jgi:hypothetical protein
MELLDFLLNSQTKQEFKKISSHIATLLYTEFYVYIWLICIYNILLFVLILANLALTIQVLRQQSREAGAHGLTSSIPQKIVYVATNNPFI